MKKAKILIALSLAFVVVMGAGVGAGTYAYYSKSMSLTGAKGASIEAKQFNPKVTDFSFTPGKIEPGQTSVSSFQVLKRNTETGMNYHIKYDLVEVKKNDINGVERGFFDNPNLHYTLSLLNEETGETQDCTIKHTAPYDPIYMYIDDQKVYYDDIVTEGEGQDKKYYYYYEPFKAKIWFETPGYSPLLDERPWHRITGIEYDYNINSKSDYTFTMTLDWPYDGDWKTDNHYINTTSRIDAHVDVIQSKPTEHANNK